jgi:hypothetical protein
VALSCLARRFAVAPLVLLALGKPALALDAQVAIVERRQQLSLLDDKAGAHRRLAQETIEGGHCRALHLTFDNRLGADSIVAVEQENTQQQEQCCGQPDTKPGATVILEMQPPAAQFVDQATGKPAMLIDPALQQGPEQSADRFENPRFLGAERRPLIALESQYANADAAAAEDHRAHRARGSKIAVSNGDAAVAFRGGRKNHAAPLIEGLVHGVFESGDELAFLLEESRM